MTLKLNAFPDNLLGPLQEDTITTLFGAPGSGKSTLAFQYLLACLREGKKVIYIDSEGGFSAERIKQMDSQAELSKVIVFSPKSFEEQHKCVLHLSKELPKQKDIGLIIVDSLVMLYRLKLGDETQKVNKELGEQLRLLTELSRSYKIPVLAINQMYQHFETKEKKMVGGTLIEYWSKTILLLEVENESRRAILKKHKFKKEGESKYFEIESVGLKAL